MRVSNRDKVKEHLTSNAIGSEIYYPMPLHVQECFSDLGYKPGDFPVSEKACQEVLALPVYPELPEEQVGFVRVNYWRRLEGAAKSDERQECRTQDRIERPFGSLLFRSALLRFAGSAFHDSSRLRVTLPPVNHIF